MLDRLIGLDIDGDVAGVAEPKQTRHEAHASGEQRDHTALPQARRSPAARQPDFLRAGSAAESAKDQQAEGHTDGHNTEQHDQRQRAGRLWQASSVARLLHRSGDASSARCRHTRHDIRQSPGLDDGSEHTLEEVGQSFAVTRERIRQIEAKALRKLRHPSRSRKLRAFLEGPSRDYL